MTEVQAMESIKAIIDSVAGKDCDKAAGIAAAALNILYAPVGVVFRTQIIETVYTPKESGLTPKDVAAIYSDIVGDRRTPA